jgi:hypothetical protein
VDIARLWNLTAENSRCSNFHGHSTIFFLLVNCFKTPKITITL